MARMLTALSDLFQEWFVPGIEDFHNTIDPAYAMVVKSNENVVRDQITKDYKAIHTFVLGSAGALRAASPGGPNMVAGTTANQLISAHETYPGIQDSPLPALDRREISIAKMRGSVVMSLEHLRADQLDTVGDYPALILQQFAEALGQQTAVSWYLNDSAQVCEIDVNSASYVCTHTAGSNVVVLTNASASVITAGPIRRLKPGLQYDIWSADMATCYTQNGWVMIDDQLDMYDGLTLTLFFQSTTDADLFATTFPTGGSEDEPWLVPYSAIPDRTSDGSNGSILPCGYKSWMRTSGQIFGNFGTSSITATSHGSMFKSRAVDTFGAVSETKLNKYIADFLRATGCQLDTMLLTPGALVDIIDVHGTASSSITYEREGKAQNTALGWERVTYRYGGKSIDLVTSDYLTGGEAVFMKAKGGNLLRYEPPMVPGATASMPDYDPRIEWLGKHFYDSIWMPSTAPGGGKTNGVEAPFDLLFNHAAKEVRGILLEGVNEETP